MSHRTTKRKHSRSSGSIPMNSVFPNISSSDKMDMVACPGGQKMSMSKGEIRHPLQNKKMRPY